MEKTANTNSVQKATQGTKTAVAKITPKQLLAIAQEYIAINKPVIPKNYNVTGAVNSFILELEKIEIKNCKPLLETYTAASVKRALQTMISGGHSLGKGQGSLIPYGKSLDFQVSASGKEASARRYNKELGMFFARVVWKGDVYKTKIMPDGRKILIEHIENEETEREFDNVVKAYAIAQIGTDSEGKPLMHLKDYTKQEIIKMAFQRPGQKLEVYKNFPMDMFLKAAKSNFAKEFIRTSDDSAIMDNINDSPYGETENAEVEKVEANKVAIDDDTDFYPADNDTVDDEITPDEMAEANAEMFGGAFDDVPMACADCGVTINEKVNEFSTKKYGKPLCFKCQKEQK